MLRASRRGDRKRVPQYSSPQLRHGPSAQIAALRRTYGNLPGSVSGAPARHPVDGSAGPRPRPVVVGSSIAPLARDVHRWTRMRAGSDTPDRVGRRGKTVGPPGSRAFNERQD
ncbi:hypothetical protein GCM10018793_29100 [Streptomyces sulfonofaciens]|uniref:Uncharacterized protein n=1 Tax=Streptomyces sulfonofaciens TaxID=68272 RepID=A0A919G737_9ACTN|nr:hypothetical protein GCM10018793_29100 [Streptomyces sulfonofaciens]